jgi:hypothetical protein
MYRHKPKYRGFLRPNLSSSGPYNNCPAEIPIKKLDKDKATSSVLVPKYLAIDLKPGRYISIENGPKAVNEPNMRIKVMYRFLVIVFRIDIVTGKITGYAREEFYATGDRIETCHKNKT